MNLEFEWDDAKAQANLKRHGVPFTEALTAFADPLTRQKHHEENAKPK